MHKTDIGINAGVIWRLLWNKPPVHGNGPFIP
jgi:hypothetical protein